VLWRVEVGDRVVWIWRGALGSGRVKVSGQGGKYQLTLLSRLWRGSLPLGLEILYGADSGH
jgi:hypothetical protein